MQFVFIFMSDFVVIRVPLLPSQGYNATQSLHFTWLEVPSYNDNFGLSSVPLDGLLNFSCDELPLLQSFNLCSLPTLNHQCQLCSVLLLQCRCFQKLIQRIMNNLILQWWGSIDCIVHEMQGKRLTCKISDDIKLLAIWRSLGFCGTKACSGMISTSTPRKLKYTINGSIFVSFYIRTNCNPAAYYIRTNWTKHHKRIDLCKPPGPSLCFRTWSCRK